MRASWKVLVTLALSLTATALLSRPPPPVARGEHQEPVLPRESLLRVLGAFHLNLVADYFWLGAIQTLGLAYDRYTYRDVYFYGNLTTDLDPDFEYVYFFTGTSVTYHLGRENWVNTDESTRMFEKGLRRFPGSLPLHVMLAFNLSHYDRRYHDAAQLLEKASRMPGAPPYLGPLATRLYAQAGNFDDGLELAETLRDTTTDPDLRATFEERVKQIQLERELVKLEQAWRSFQTKAGRPPRDIGELVSKGELTAPPVDPLGGQIRINEEGVASSSSADRRLRVFDMRDHQDEEDDSTATP